MVAFNKEFKDVRSALTFLTSDGITGAYLMNGKIVAPGSKFDGKNATEKNLLKAADSTGYKMPKTNINDYIFPEAKQVPEKLPNYGDLIPKIPENYREPKQINPKNIPFPPIFRQGIDPMGMPNRNLGTNNNMVMNTNRPNNTLVKLATMQKLGLLT